MKNKTDVLDFHWNVVLLKNMDGWYDDMSDNIKFAEILKCIYVDNWF